MVESPMRASALPEPLAAAPIVAECRLRIPQRGGNSSLKLIVQTYTDDLLKCLPIVSDLTEGGGSASAGAARQARNTTRSSGCVAQIKRKVLDLGGPVVRERPFGATAGCPADFCRADRGWILLGTDW